MSYKHVLALFSIFLVLGAGVWVFAQSEPEMDGLPVGELPTRSQAILKSGDHLYVARGMHVLIYDASDVDNIRLVSKSPLLHSEILELDVVGQRLYTVNRAGMLTVLDVSDLTMPSVLAEYHVGFGELSDIVVEGDYAYVAKRIAVYNGENGLHILDISDPLAINEVGFYFVDDEYVHHSRLVVDGSLVYYSASQLHVVDVSDPTNPTQVGFHESPRGNYGDLVLNREDKVLYLLTDLYRLFSLDVSDVDNIRVMGEHGYSGWGNERLGYGNGRLLKAFDGMRLLDVSDPTRLLLRTNFDWAESWSGHLQDVYVEDNTVYGLSSSGGIFVGDASDVYAPETLAVVQDGITYYADGVWPVGNNLYLWDATWSKHDKPQRVSLVDITSPVAMEQDPFSGGFGLASVVENNYLYTMANEDSPVLLKYDLTTEPFEPVMSANVPIDGYEWFGIWEIYVGGNKIYLRTYDSILAYDKNTFTFLGASIPPEEGQDYEQLAVNDEFAFVLVASSGETNYWLHVIEFSEDEPPTTLVTHLIAEDEFRAVYEIATSRDYLYIAKDPNPEVTPVTTEIEVWDMSDILIPDRDIFYMEHHILEMNPMTGGYLQLEMYQENPDLTRFLILDTHQNPKEPSIAFSRIMDSAWFDHQFALQGHELYLLDNSAGLKTYWFAPPTVSTVSPTVDGSLSDALDGTSYTFPAGTFATTATVTHTAMFPNHAPATYPLVDVDVYLEVTAEHTLAPSQTYTITVPYNPLEVEAINPESLALYWWDGSEWVVVETAVHDPINYTFTATPNQLGLFAILGEVEHHSYLPILRK